jgi:hypothetical protein
MGVLKARVGSSWQAIGTGVGEVFVGPNDPGTNVGIELWYDSDDNSVISPSTVGLEANRPPATPANASLHNFATDTLNDWLCTGTTWITNTPTPWVAPTLLNGWVNYGGGFQVVQYRLRGDMVDLRGMIKSGTFPAVVCTLPVGFRPTLYQMVAVASSGIAGTLQINVDGGIQILTGAATYMNLTCSYPIG